MDEFGAGEGKGGAFAGDPGGGEVKIGGGFMAIAGLEDLETSLTGEGNSRGGMPGNLGENLLGGLAIAWLKRGGGGGVLEVSGVAIFVDA